MIRLRGQMWAKIGSNNSLNDGSKPEKTGRIKMNSSAISNHQTGFEIAIIGMSGRFPGARDINEFWQNLRDGRESITFFSDEELAFSNIDPAVCNDSSYVKARGVLEGAELFDAAFFGFSPREAE